MLQFETAGVEVAWWLPPLVALVVSTFTSMGGVSGAFLLLPFQVSVLGYVSPSVSATNQLYNIVAIPAGVYRYVREGRMVWPLALAVVFGTLPGVFVGAWVRIEWLPDPTHFKLFAAVVLLYIAGRMGLDLVRAAAGGQAEVAEQRFQQLVADHRRRSEHLEQRGLAEQARTRVLRLSWRRIEYAFYGEVFRVSTIAVTGLSLAVGLVGGIYGIGGGAIIAPFFISILRLPVYTVAGAALLGTLVTSVAGVAFYSLLARSYPGQSVAPDWGLGLLFGLGGMVGMYLGARLQKRVPARLIKWMLAGVLLFTAGKYVWEFVAAR